MGTIIWRFLSSPANWSGMVVALLVLGARIGGLLGSMWLPLVLGGYVAGYWLGKSVFGTPKLVITDLDALDAALIQHEKPEGIDLALSTMRQILIQNQEERFSGNQQRKVIALIDAISLLHQEWSASSAHLSIEDAFVAKRLALEYLPETIRGYLAIPARFTASKVLASNKTAAQLFDDAVDEMQAKVEQLQFDLAAKDADAFVNHAGFLNQKFSKKFDPTGRDTKVERLEAAPSLYVPQPLPQAQKVESRPSSESTPQPPPLPPPLPPVAH
jgi:hypothetical protein